MSLGNPIFSRQKLFDLLYERNKGFRNYKDIEMVRKKDLYNIHDSVSFKCNKSHYVMEMTVLDLLRSNFLLVGKCDMCIAQETERRDVLLDRF